MILLLALQAVAQPPATLVLPAPDRTLQVDFTQIRGVRELADARVIITDRLDKGVVVADFTRNSTTPIGRTGSGPAEYRLPTGLWAMPGDSTLLNDEGNRRPRSQPVSHEIGPVPDDHRGGRRTQRVTRPKDVLDHWKAADLVKDLGHR